MKSAPDTHILSGTKRPFLIFDNSYEGSARGGGSHTPSKAHKGRFGIHSVTRIPKIAGYAGSVKAFRLIPRRRLLPTRAESLTTRWPNAPTGTSMLGPKPSSTAPRSFALARPRG